MKTVIPHLPIQTIEEMKVYKNSVIYYPAKRPTDIVDWHTMAEDWNQGRLKGILRQDSVLNANTLRKKMPFHLKSYYKIYERAINSRAMITLERAPLKDMTSALANHRHTEPLISNPPISISAEIPTVVIQPQRETIFAAPIEAPEPVLNPITQSQNVLNLVAPISVGIVANYQVPRVNAQLPPPPKKRTGLNDPMCQVCRKKKSEGCTGGARPWYCKDFKKFIGDHEAEPMVKYEWDEFEPRMTQLIEATGNRKMCEILMKQWMAGTGKSGNQGQQRVYEAKQREWKN
jgi:hypothetical protein